MSSDMTYGPVKPLSKMTKKELIQIATDRIQSKIAMKQEFEYQSEMDKSVNNVLKSKIEVHKQAEDNLIKDMEIMQQALNDVEEKNRFLNNQVTDLRKTMKTMSQFL